VALLCGPSYEVRLYSNLSFPQKHTPSM
jgi:hypothetical protein